MKIARALAPRTLRSDSARPAAPANAPARPFARCEVHTTIEDARAPWAELEACAIAPPYQGFAFLNAWRGTVGRACGVTPFIVVGRDAAGTVNALLPFGVTRVGPLAIASFLGGKDANFNMGLYRPGVAADGPALRDLLRRAAAMGAPRIAGFHCLNQPVAWEGVANPMAALGGRPSPSAGHKTAPGLDFPVWLNAHYSREAHKKLRKKTQRLDALGPLKHRIARDSASTRGILAAFAAQKDARMRELGLGRRWNRDLYLAFLAEAAEAGSLELHALSCGERIVAVFGGLARGDRLCGMFISHDGDPQIARCSPGELLLNEIIRDLTERRFATFDLGVGEARYKTHCCEAEEPLFDTFVATRLSGHVMGATLLASLRVKRFVKQTPAVWRLVERMRRRTR